jgi:hypothetical protein
VMTFETQRGWRMAGRLLIRLLADVNYRVQRQRQSSASFQGSQWCCDSVKDALNVACFGPFIL